MDCRETQTLLPAFHDGELPAADRVRVEDHLRGCPECGALLADLERADQAAGVPDPGPAYWDRFNARVMDRVGREADGPGVTVLRPKGGWMRQQLRYLVPAAAVAALVVVVVRYGGMHPGVPVPGVPPAVSEPAAPVPVEQRRTDSEPGSRAAKKTESAEVARRVPPPAVARERSADVAREERDRPAGLSLPAGNMEASRDRPAAPADSAPATVPDGTPPKMRSERKNAPGATAPTAEQQAAATGTSAAGMRIAKEAAPDGHGWPGAGTGRDAPGSAVPAGSPCEMARTLSGRERFREAEDAQRACLAGKLPDPAREKGLVFLAELLDRQARFADADAVIAEVDRRFPQSRPLDLYRQQRPMVQKQPITTPGTR
ncbi:MAG: zf-HC2 domain-containing protein [Candidatus Deferrimicrobium sp.]